MGTAGVGVGWGGYQRQALEASEITEIVWSKTLKPQALSRADFRVLFLFKGGPPQQDPEAT